MRYEKGHKETTRRRILEVASRKFREDGVAAVGLTGIMADSGLTNGGFYTHFESKADLVCQTMLEAMRTQRESFGAIPGGDETFETVVRAYLSASHRDAPGSGCPSAALLPEIARQDHAMRAAYTENLDAFLALIGGHLPPGDPAAARGRAASLYAMLLGALQLARAVSDPRLSDEILGGAVQAALALRDSYRAANPAPRKHKAPPATAPATRAAGGRPRS